MKSSIATHPISNPGPSSSAPMVSALPKVVTGRPLLLGKHLDGVVQEYISALCKAGGIVNTSLVLGAAEGIVTAKNPGLLAKHGGHIELTKSWAKSLFQQMGYVKRKGSNAGKVTVADFQEVKEVFMHDIQPGMIFNWDQTGINYVSTGQWTMHQSGDKVVPIAHSDDKRQITAVLAVTMTGKYFAPQLIYQGKTNRCHPVITFPEEWDIWHTESHWSNEESMKRYIRNIIVPFVVKLREDLQLHSDSPALALFDCFKGQTTPEILTLLRENNIRVVQIPSNCTDKLQPIDISLSKTLKDALRRSFQTRYAEEVQS